jgi:hypothetical protein
MCLLLLVCTVIFPPLGAALQSIPEGHSYGTFFLGVFFLFLGGSAWALVGGFAATALRNRYLAYAMPFILYYMLSVFQERYWGAFYVLNPREWVYPEHLGLVPTLILSGVALIIDAVLYSIIMRRRIVDV